MKYHSSMRLNVIGRYVCPCEIVTLYQARVLQLSLAIQAFLRIHPKGY